MRIKDYIRLAKGSVEMQTLILNYRFPSLNEYTNANRASKYQGASIKKNFTALTKLEAKRQKLYPITQKVYIKFTWVEANKKRDMDNVAAAKKFILDGLVDAGILVNDNWEYIQGFQDTFKIEKKNRVIVEIEEV